jgi:hypothetical protein
MSVGGLVSVPEPSTASLLSLVIVVCSIFHRTERIWSARGDVLECDETAFDDEFCSISELP